MSGNAGDSDRDLVISGPGDFITRDGSRVTIHSVGGKGTFSASGSVWKEFRGKIRPHGYEIWAPDGRYLAVPEHPWDIVGPWPEDRPEPELTPG